MNCHNVRPLSCVSCVPASCFLIWLVSCPRFMSLLVNSVPGVCVWLCVYYPVYLSPVCWVPCRLVYLLFPVFLSVYLALSYLDVQCRPMLTLAHRTAADSMPAGLPLIQTRRIAADSSSPDCRWLMPAGRRWRGKPTRHFLSSRRPRLTDPAVRGRSRRRPCGKPTHRRRLPLARGEGQIN